MNSNREILIVDDDEGIGILLQQRLKRHGVEVAIAKTGRAALNWLEENEAVLMLLDLGLPDITGKELLELLEKRGKSLPFIVVSGSEDVRITVEMMQLGALDFILKDSVLLELVVPVVKRGLETLEAHRKFKESQQRLRYICETISDVFWMMDAHVDQVIYVSPSFEDIWEIPVEQLYAYPGSWHDCIVEDDRSKVLRSFEKLRQGTERDFDEVYRIRDRLGKERWIRSRGRANYGEGENILNITGIATDVTEHKALERQILEIAEKERMRIGQDLHDDLCQRLAAISLKCGIVHGVLMDEDHEEADSLEGITWELKEATGLVLTIAKGLSPVSLEAEGLMEGLRHFTGMIAGRFGLSCSFDCPEPVEVSNATTASHVFRIAQELVNNAAKHARPRRILVGLYNAMGGLRLEVTNDGRPFYGPKRRREGMGLHFIQFRTDAIGASLDFFPGDPPDGGTRVVCTVPLRRLEEAIH